MDSREKAVELGVHVIQPLQAERSVVRLSVERAAKRLAHWQGVAVAACEQCGRNRVPQVLPVAALDAWLGAVPEAALRLTLTPGAQVRLTQLGRPQGAVVLLAGPEGGLSPREHENASRGIYAVRLVPRVLRTETAAVAASRRCKHLGDSESASSTPVRLSLKASQYSELNWEPASDSQRPGRSAPFRTKRQDPGEKTPERLSPGAASG